MKRLVLGTLIALAVTQAAGCVVHTGGDDDDDPPNPNNYAHVSATWDIRSIATNTSLACPSGYNTAALFNQAVDANDQPIGNCTYSTDNNNSTCFVDLFDCIDHAGTSYPLPPTRYITWVAITDNSTTSVWGESVPAYVDITNVDKTYSTQLLEDGGYFYVSWNLVGAVSNNNLSCASAGAGGGVELTATVVGSTEAKADQWDCANRSGYTAGLRAATYTVSLQALNTSDQAISETPELTNKVIRPFNAVTDLGLVNVPITGL